MTDIKLKNMIGSAPRTIALVVIENGKDFHYKRFVGRKLENYVVTDGPLQRSEVEAFRAKPLAFTAMYNAMGEA